MQTNLRDMRNSKRCREIDRDGWYHSKAIFSASTTLLSTPTAMLYVHVHE